MVNYSNNKRRSQFDIRRYRAPSLYNDSSANNNKQKKIPGWLGKGIFFGIILLVLSYLVLFSSAFRIKEIIVEGDSLISADQIKASISTGQNIFRFNIANTVSQLKTQFPELQSVEIYRGIPNAIKVVVLERQGKIVWQSNNEKYLISDQGEVMQKIDSDKWNDLPVVADMKNLPVTLGAQLVSPNFIAFITNIYNNFYNGVNIKPLGFEVGETTFDVNLHTDAGFYVKFNSLRSSKKQLENLKTVLIEKRPDIHEYVDIRIDGWAYYK
jgi:cell division septal protein FtsQ